MPIPVTEVALVPMVAGVDLRDPENFGCKIAKYCGAITAKQPGYERGVWGCLGNESQTWFTLTDWDSLESHEEFTKKPEHDEELVELAKICNEAIQVFHLDLEYASGTTADSKVRSPVVDIVLGYFPVEQAKSIMSGKTHLNGHVNGESKAEIVPSSFASGWATEDDGPCWDTSNRQCARPGKPVEKPWFGLFGWNSADKQHRQVQEDYINHKTRWIEAMGGEKIVGRMVFTNY